ncbi:MAG: substrate-binding domain-containing protein [Actinomycetota bacterium]|nr:substrate-binding domain-containing protein [Actinomycetota bacterium]
MAARLLALIAAVAMVVGSLAIRSRLDESSGEGAGGGGGDKARLVCSTELSQVCEALEEDLTVLVEPAGVTADRLAKAPDGPASLDGWLVPAPWPEVVRNARQRSGLSPMLDAAGPPLARSPLVLAVWPDQAAVLRQRCPGGQLTWRCWADLAGQGQLKPGHSDVDEAVGLATVGAATAGFFAGRADLARADLEDNDEYRSWLARLERSVRTFRPVSGSALRDMLLKGPVEFDSVGTTEAEAAPLVAASARTEKPMIIYPSPVATVDVVLATVPGARVGRMTRSVGADTGLDALARSGWRVPGRRPASGVPSQPELPAAGGLPDAGILDFLRTLSKEVTR